MTSRWGILVAAFALTASLSQAQTGALQEGRLTGRGKAALTVTSGRYATDTTVAVNFDGVIASGALREGSFRLKSPSASIPVAVDGLEHRFDELQADIVNGTIRVDRPGSFHLAGTANVNVAGFQFTGHASLDGTLDSGGAILFSVALGARGERGTITGAGTWTSGPGFTINPGPANQNHLLTGRYSGELHGLLAGEHYAAVLVLAFDGAGHITSGRIHAHAETWETEHAVPANAVYSVDLDGFGFIELVGFGLRIAVADQGRIVKLAGQHLTFGTATVQIVGELVKQ